MIEFEIDGKKLSAEQGKMIIEVADNEGIYIPRFCYHKKLSIAANCRMCLVEVEKSGKPLPACATPVTAGMKVFTKSSKAIAAQRSVMEFLLINHPLDCPICDQGGECELQDLSMGYGSDFSRYKQGKRSVHDKNLGPLIASEMTRCIQCTRCVRFGEEIAGMRELGAYNRGEHLEIGTYVERAVKSELSGNVIDLCPVGALTSKPFRFTARAWEMIQRESIAPHDCVGSNIYVHTRGEEYSKIQNVMRVVPRANEAINETWISDRDRFSYGGVRSEDRVMQPKLKKGDKWQNVSWEAALVYVVENLKSIIKKQGAKQIGAVASPNSTLEEFYLLQKLLRGLGSHNIDHRIRQTDFSDQEQFPAYPNLGISIDDLEKPKAILLIGSDIRREQPLLGNRVRKAAEQGAQVMCINAMDYHFNFDLSEKNIVGSELLASALAKVAKALGVAGENIASPLKTFIDEVEIDSAAQNIANKLKMNEKAALLLGAHALNHPHATLINVLTQLIAKQINATVGYLTDGANSAGAWIAGAVPHRGPAANTIAKPGLNAQAMFADSLKAYLLLGIEPELDCANSAAALAALQQAEVVVALTPFTSPTIETYARVILPIAPFTETEGTFVNVEGRWQGFQPTSTPLGEARPAWKVLRVLGNLLELKGFEYATATEIHHEVWELNSAVPALKATEKFSANIPKSIKGLMRIGDWHMYRIDNLVRRSKPLQAAINLEVATIAINPALAKSLNLKDGQYATAKQNGSSVTLPIRIDARVPDNNVFIPAGLNETAGFGAAFGAIELRSAERG